MKTDTQVLKSDPNLRGPKHPKDWICLVIYDFFKGEGPYMVENKETFFSTGLGGG